MAAINFKKKWHSLTPKTRTAIALGTLFGGMILVATLIGKVQSPAMPKQRVAPSETNILLPKKQDNSVEVLAASNDVTKERLTKLQEDLERERSNNAALLRKFEDEQLQGAREAGVNADLVKEVMAMKSRLDDIERNKRQTGSSPAPMPSDPIPNPDGSGAGVPLSATIEAPKLRVVGGTSGKKAATPPTQQPIAYLPPGSLFEVVLLNGMDAPTNAVAQKNPVPSLVRVKTDALLPNNFNHDIKECFALVSGYGSLSSERAYLRSEVLSCVRENGHVVEAKLNGYVVGEDGRVGVRGRLVSKQGQMVAKALAAGVLNGFSQALTPQQIPQINLSPTPTTQYQSANLQSIAESGVARGAADAAKTASQFFMEMAHEMTPIVEVDAGRKVTLILTKGVELTELK